MGFQALQGSPDAEATLVPANLFRVRPFSATVLLVSLVHESEEIARAAGGDRLAQSALVTRHTPGIYAVAFRMLRNKGDAEDVVQETFLRAWKAMPAWEPRAKLSTWLHRVALNLCFDRLRRTRERATDSPPEQVDHGLGPGEQLDQAQRVAAIEEAIAKLPDRQRAALVLCRLEGRTNIEAASIMQVSVDALESLLARARRTLKMQLLNGKDRGLG